MLEFLLSERQFLHLRSHLLHSLHPPQRRRPFLCLLPFLLDVSGSMNLPERLPLVKSSLRLLVDNLRSKDNVSLVTYADGSQVVLKPT
ncbi:MAG: VWA domain-containing protein [Synergistaceae bacterium]|nr:VWA domain-containing protein [Synergistaceae bacterium]